MQGFVQNMWTHQKQGTQIPAVHVGGKQQEKIALNDTISNN